MLWIPFVKLFLNALNKRSHCKSLRELGNVFLPVWLHFLTFSLFYYVLVDCLFYSQKAKLIRSRGTWPYCSLFLEQFHSRCLYGSLLLILQAQLKHYCHRDISAHSPPCPPAKVACSLIPFNSLLHHLPLFSIKHLVFGVVILHTRNCFVARLLHQNVGPLRWRYYLSTSVSQGP